MTSFDDEEPGQRLYRTTREARAARRRRRRRRVVAAVARFGLWLLLLSGVFVLGMGVGRVAPTVTDDPAGQVTIDAERGPLTVTLPERTVTQTQTRTVTVRQRAGGGSAED